MPFVGKPKFKIGDVIKWKDKPYGSAIGQPILIVRHLYRADGVTFHGYEVCYDIPMDYCASYPKEILECDCEIDEAWMRKKLMGVINEPTKTK